jgi:dolichyl-diphosphooligosaccharide--protein glycosyltransferase
LRNRFNDLFGGGQAVDRVRQQVIPSTPIELNVVGKSWPSDVPLCAPLTRSHLSHTAEEAFTSENWIVRIFAVKKEDDIGRGLPESTAFEKGIKLKKSRSAKAGGVKKKGAQKA